METMTRAELSRRWGVTRQAVGKMFSRPDAPAFDASGKIGVDVAEAFRAERQEARQAGGEWRQELDRLRCVLLEHEIAERAAALVSRADVRAVALADAAAINAALRGMADAVAPQLVGAVSIEAVRGVLSRWARSTLQGWHDSLEGKP